MFKRLVSHSRDTFSCEGQPLFSQTQTGNVQTYFPLIAKIPSGTCGSERGPRCPHYDPLFKQKKKSLHRKRIIHVYSAALG